MRKRGYRENCVKQKPSRGYDLVLTMSAVFGVKSTKPLDPRKSMPAILVRYGAGGGSNDLIWCKDKTFIDTGCPRKNFTLLSPSILGLY